MRALPLTAVLAALAAPAYGQVIDEPNGGSITQSYLVQYRLEGSPPFPPELVGYGEPHDVGQVIDPGSVDPTVVYSSVPMVTIDAPVTLSDLFGDTYVFNAIVSVGGMAAMIANAFEVPLSAEAGGALGVAGFIVDVYSASTKITYAGVQNFVAGVLMDGITQINSGHLPIGPGDPLYDFSWTIGATTFSGSFDGFGPIDAITGIHNIAMTVDGVPVTGGSVVPEPATWVLILIGFAGLGLVARRRYERA